MAAQPIWAREGYSSRNQYRSAKAREQINPETGKPFTSYRQQRDYRAKAVGKPRNTAAERQRRDTLAQSRGYESSNRERAVKNALKKWDVDYGQFNAWHRENRKHWGEVQRGNLAKKFPTYLHRYEPPKNASAPEWVGYIVSYYHAIVDPEHNWDSKRDSNGRWRLTEAMVPGDSVPHIVPESDIWWYRHFVQYSNKRQANYYETRYGIADV